MVTRDDVLQVLATGLGQREAAARLGISQQRVSQLKRGVSGHPASTSASTSPAVVQPEPASTSEPVNTAQSASTSPDLAALREQHRAEFTASLRPRWDALAAERDQLRARVAELENSPAAPPAGSCPGCAERDAAYDQLEADRDGLARRLAAWEEPA